MGTSLFGIHVMGNLSMKKSACITHVRALRLTFHNPVIELYHASQGGNTFDNYFRGPVAVNHTSFSRLATSFSLSEIYLVMVPEDQSLP